MELFRLFGVIDIDNKKANNALDETSNAGKNAESKLSRFFTGVGKGAVAVGKAVGTGMLAAGTAVAGLSTTAIKSYAEYEQLVGGVETLFGDSAKKVIQYAEQAYKTAGLSANGYMETVTSFSASLLQSLDGDTIAAAEKANQAIIDMSDNANKMGTSMEMIQNAYQGFAKQNYTMLDNLKLGYGGTKEEMARLLEDAQAISGIEYDISSYADIVDAIHVIQDEMGITGTTVKEASSTISGSIASMKGQWENMMTALATGNDDVVQKNITAFVDSVGTVADNLIPTIENVLDGVIQLIEQLAPKIIAKIPGLVATLLPAIVEATANIGKALVEVVPQAFQTLKEMFITYAPELYAGIGNMITGIADFIQTNLPIVTEKAKEMVSGLGQKIEENLPTLISKGLDILLGLSESILQNIPTLVATGMDLIKSLVKGLVAALPELIAKVPQIIINLANTISNSMQTIFMKGLEIVWELIKGIIGAIPDLIRNIPKIIEAIIAVWNAVNWMNLGKNLIKGISNGIKNMGNSLKSTAKNLFTKLDEMIGNIFKSIGKSIMNPINSAKSLFSTAVSGIKNVATNVFSALKGSVTSVFNGIKNAIVNPIQTAKTTIKNIVEAIKGFFNFKISFPKIPLPHFSISPSGWSVGDLLKGSIPKLSIDWYKKAMDTPMIMTSPTAFGINANGQIMAGGEAGSEVVSGTETLMNMISAAVAAQNEELINIITRLFAFLQEYLPEMARMQLVMDTGTIVGELAPGMDKALGKISYRKGRGV